MSDSETNLQELHFLEQNLQNIIYQKQAFQMELSETSSALKEIKNTKEDVFKIIGQLMIKSGKDKIIKELEDKSNLLNLKINSLEKQEETFNQKISSLREKIITSSKP
jgi:prefoldin beta subunit